MGKQDIYDNLAENNILQLFIDNDIHFFTTYFNMLLFICKSKLKMYFYIKFFII